MAEPLDLTPLLQALEDVKATVVQLAQPQAPPMPQAVAVQLPDLGAAIQALTDAATAIRETPPITQITVPEQIPPDINVTVSPTPVTVTTPAPVVHMPEQKAPAAPVVHVAPAQVTVEAPVPAAEKPRPKRRIVVKKQRDGSFEGEVSDVTDE